MFATTIRSLIVTPANGRSIQVPLAKMHTRLMSAPATRMDTNITRAVRDMSAIAATRRWPSRGAPAPAVVGITVAMKTAARYVAGRSVVSFGDRLTNRTRARAGNPAAISSRTASATCEPANTSP